MGKNIFLDAAPTPPAFDLKSGAAYKKAPIDLKGGAAYSLPKNPLVVPDPYAQVDKLLSTVNAAGEKAGQYVKGGIVGLEKAFQVPVQQPAEAPQIPGVPGYKKPSFIPVETSFAPAAPDTSTFAERFKQGFKQGEAGQQEPSSNIFLNEFLQKAPGELLTQGAFVGAGELLAKAPEIAKVLNTAINTKNVFVPASELRAVITGAGEVTPEVQAFVKNLDAAERAKLFRSGEGAKIRVNRNLLEDVKSFFKAPEVPSISTEPAPVGTPQVSKPTFRGRAADVLNKFVPPELSAELTSSRATGELGFGPQNTPIPVGKTPVSQSTNIVEKFVKPTESAPPIPESKNINDLGDVFKDPQKLENYKLPKDLQKTPDIKSESGARAVLDSVMQHTLPIDVVLKHMGENERTILNAVNRVDRNTDVIAGGRNADLEKSGLSSLNKLEAFNLKDVLEGKADPVNRKVAEVADVARQQGSDIATEAGANKVTIKTGEGDVPFTPRQNYFHHRIPPVNELVRGEIRKDVLLNAVHDKAFPDIESASKGLDEFVTYLKTENPRAPKSMMKYLVDSGQAPDDAAALEQLKFLKKTIRSRQFGAFRARTIDLPFYDPDPRRVLPEYNRGAARFIEQSKEFGNGDWKIKKLVEQIKERGGDAKYVEDAFNTIQGTIEHSDKAERASKALIAFQAVTKLGLSFVSNATQSALSLLASDLPSLVSGIKGALTEEGKLQALRAGLKGEGESIPAGQEGFLENAGGKILKPFSKVETFNRRVAANTGAKFAERLLDTLIKKPHNKTAQDILQKLIPDLNVEEAIIKGGLSEKEVDMAARNFVDQTQFSTSAKRKAPFFSTPFGRVVYQFKHFGVESTRFLIDQTINEARSGHYERSFRNLLIIASIFPIAGEARNDVVAAINGKTRPDFKKHYWQRYLDDIAAVGTFGILGNFFDSADIGRFEGSLLGPTGSDIADTANAAAADYAKLRNGEAGNALLKVGIKHIPVVGTRLKSELYPPGAKEIQIPDFLKNVLPNRQPAKATGSSKNIFLQ